MRTTEMASRSEGERLTLISIRPVVVLGPFFSLLAGISLVANHPSDQAMLGLLVFCAIYLVIGYVMYRRVCRMAGFHLALAVSSTIPSGLFFLAALDQASEGLSPALGSLSGVGFLTGWALPGFLLVARGGLIAYLDSYYGRKEVDREKGLFDLTNHTRRIAALRAGKVASVLRADMSPHDRSWFEKWGWLIALFIFSTPIWVALSGGIVQEMSPGGRGIYFALLCYVMAIINALLAGTAWIQYALWRHWERDNGRPMLIRYLEDRYRPRRNR